MIVPAEPRAGAAVTEPPGQAGVAPAAGTVAGTVAAGRVRARARTAELPPDRRPPRLAADDTGPRVRWRLVDATPREWTRPPRDDFVFHVLRALLVVTLLGQRLVVPLGGLPIALPLIACYVAVVVLRLRGGLRYNRVRMELFLLATIALTTATWVNGALGHQFSMNSLLLLLVIYLPWVFCVAPQYRHLMPRLLRTLVRLMTGVAVVAIVQMALQLSGVWAYEDYVLDRVPPHLLAADYNTSFPMTWDSPIHKANAFLFLEPSFLCQFLGLAVLVALVVRAPAWQPLVLGVGMACTLSGTGIILLVTGLAVLLLRSPRTFRPGYVVAGVVALVVVFQSPAAAFLLDRSGEASEQGSSGNLRFVQPYTEVLRGFAAEPDRYLWGAGPGMADRLLESARGKHGVAVVYTIAPKVAFEYGLVAAVLFVAFLLVAILRGPPLHALPCAVIVMIFFLSGSLLQPHTIITAWLVANVWGHPVTLGLTDALAAWRRQTVADAQRGGP